MTRTLKKKLEIGGNGFTVNLEAYGSAMDVASDCKAREVHDKRFDDFTRRSVDRDWYGVDSYEEALRLLADGYQPTVEKLKDTLKISRMGNGKRIAFQNNIAGFAPIVPLALKGVPNCMVGMTMKQIKCKVVDVYYDLAVPCYVSTETIVKNGQKLLETILRLEAEGYRFNLFGMQAYSDEKSADILTVKVKSSDKPIDLKRMSFPLTHPAFFRVIGFDWYSRFPESKYRSGYGRALKHTIGKNGADELIKKLCGDNAIYFSGAEMTDADEEHLKEVLTNAKAN